jgi:hypothetical protein
MIAAVLVVVSCTSSLGTGIASTTPLASTRPACLSGQRLDFLADQFFVRYNARDMDGFLGLFLFSVPAAGGGFGSYTDNPGESRTISDRAGLSDYLRTRWAMDDRFVSWSAGGNPDGLNYPNANPTISFTRSFAGVTHVGNAKLVCNSGLLVDVVMSSRKP